MKMAFTGANTLADGKQRGSATILFTFISLFVVLPIVGLAIDGSIVFWQKARLASSVDAAAYAAGRSLSLGATVQAAQAAASSTATTYFNANFKPGLLGTTASVTPNVPAPTNAGLWTISVDATATVPLYFLRFLGVSTSNLAAHAQISRRNVNIILILDRSASMSVSNSCTALISAAQNFVNLFVSGQDDLGLITFQTTANLDFPPDINFKTKPTYLLGVNGLPQLIGQLKCTGYTNTVAALNLAYQQIKNINQPSSLNVIVFFSDGKPDAITGTFKVKDKVDIRDQVASPYSSWSAPASSCTGGDMTGILVSLGEDEDDATGSTLGVIPNPPCSDQGTCGDPISSNPPYFGLAPSPLSSSAAPGCSFSTTSVSIQNSGGNTTYSGGAFNVRNDILSVPTTDFYKNATNTSYHPLTVANWSLFSSSTPQKPLIRPDTPAAIVKSAFNAAFEQVKAIRSDTKFKPVIYSIGLGSDVDDDFMMDVANDLSAPNPDPTSPRGKYIYAPTASQLSSAFQQIASQVLRISQ